MNQVRVSELEVRKMHDQATRLISAGRLSVLPRLHFQSIEVVVFDRPLETCVWEI